MGVLGSAGSGGAAGRGGADLGGGVVVAQPVAFGEAAGLPPGVLNVVVEEGLEGSYSASFLGLGYLNTVAAYGLSVGRNGGEGMTDDLYIISALGFRQHTDRTEVREGDRAH